MLALIHAGRLGDAPVRFLRRLNPYILMLLLAAASRPDTGFMNYLRPYFAMMLVGATLQQADTPLGRLLRSRVLAYVATISYALYVIHPLLVHSWLGEGDKIVKYLKRPLLFALLFMLAHISTFHFEKRCIGYGKWLSNKIVAKRPAPAAP